MKNRFIALLFVIFCLAVVGIAEATEDKLSTSEAVRFDIEKASISKDSNCSDNSHTMFICSSFIEGFIQGALLTDAAIIKSIEDTEPTFTERAFKTRLESGASRPVTELAGFCLPEKRSVKEITEETLEQVKHSKVDAPKLAENVYDLLKSEYRC